MTYTQHVKTVSRKELWRHAVKALTVRRESSKIFRYDYMESLWEHVWKDRLCEVFPISEYDPAIWRSFEHWINFSNSIYGTKRPEELRVAYFSGPEPENDLEELHSLGVRIENVWAFESNNRDFFKALKKARKNFPLLKIFPGKITDFIKTTHQSFDIIYLDFTRSLVAQGKNPPMKTLHDIFDQQALSELSVLIVNSCEPAATPDVYDFLASYFAYQPWMEFSASTSELGYLPKFDGFDYMRDFIQENRHKAYSAFATSYPLYYSNFVSPTLRLLNNNSLKKQLFSFSNSKKEEAELESIFEHLSNYEDGIRHTRAEQFPFWNFIEHLKDKGETSKYWHNKFTDKPSSAYGSTLRAVQFRETISEMTRGFSKYTGEFTDGEGALLSAKMRDEMKRIYEIIPDTNRPIFCDRPMSHLWLELALNQLGAPYHSRVGKHRRWTYTAKTNQMYLDAFTFDRCRSLYDSLPLLDMYGDVLGNSLIDQMIVRCCLDAICKQSQQSMPTLYDGTHLAYLNDIDIRDVVDLEPRVQIAS